MTYLGDLNKTQAIEELFQTDQGDRDPAWQKSFLDNVVEASFRSGEPQIINGPDGFPYFTLSLPVPNQEFQCFVIKHMIKDFLLAKGCGVVIQPEENSAQWVFSYGDLVNYHLNGLFYPEATETNPQEKASSSVPALISQPAESYLPEATRAVLRDYLAKATNTRILLMTRPTPNGLAQELIFEIDPQQFETPELYQQICQRLSWFLPRQYRYSTIGLNSSFAASLEPL